MLENGITFNLLQKVINNETFVGIELEPFALSGNKLQTYLGAINKQFPSYKRIVLTERCTIWADDFIIIFHMWASDSFRDISDGQSRDQIPAGVTRSPPQREIVKLPGRLKLNYSFN